MKLNLPNSKLVALSSIAGASLLSAQDVASLWITEVSPSTGQVEVTNISDEPITTSSTLPFCHRFNYQTGVPADTTFAPGQSRLFVATGLSGSAASSDLWIYSDRRFGNANALQNGLQWGPPQGVGAFGIGRVGVAVNGGNWDARPSAVVFQPGTTESGESLSIRLTGPDPFSAANWTVGPPDLGTFTPVVPDFEVEIALRPDEVELSWIGGAPPYQVVASSDLVSFTPVSDILDSTSITLPRPEGGRQFYRVEQVELSATFAVTLQSNWTSENFANVPADRSFSNLVGTTHNADFSLWSRGELASAPFVELARDGSTGAAAALIDAAITQGSAESLFQDVAINEEGGSRTVEITVNRSHSLLSFGGALDPAPDWFVGLSSFELVDSSGRWIQSLDRDLQIYDAGVDSGESLEEASSPSSPFEPITLLGDDASFAPSTDAAAGEERVPVATLSIRRIDNL